jgi:hypothetical protein
MLCLHCRLQCAAALCGDRHICFCCDSSSTSTNSVVHAPHLGEGFTGLGLLFLCNLLYYILLFYLVFSHLGEGLTGLGLGLRWTAGEGDGDACTAGLGLGLGLPGTGEGLAWPGEGDGRGAPEQKQHTQRQQQRQQQLVSEHQGRCCNYLLFVVASQHLEQLLLGAACCGCRTAGASANKAVVRWAC